MRTVTATEKYNAVLEGRMAKSEFVRQMRQEFPMFISNFDVFDSTVSVLKTRNILFEEQTFKKPFQEAKVYDDRPALNYSLDALDRGIRTELELLGVQLPEDKVEPEVYFKAESKAKENLHKDPMHYLNLLSGESSNVDKHDKPVETKRGAEEVDTFNGMKKADLKENKKELAKLLKEGKLEDLADRLGVPVEKLKGAADKIKDMERQSAERDALKLAKMKEVIDEEEEKLEEVEGHMVDEHEYEFFSIIFNKKYNDILEDYLSSDSFKQDEKELQDKTGQANVFDYAYRADWENYIREFESINRSDAADTYNFEAKEEVSEDIEAFSDTIQVVGYPETVEDALKVIERYERDRDPVSREEAKEIIADMRATDDDDFDRNITNLIVKAFNIKLKGVSEKKGKDHDGDGDVDGDDYMASKDKAIKKAMGKDEQLKEAIKSIITKVLEEGTVNEAATNQLARYAEEYQGFDGMKETIIALQNIVTEIESFYDKTRTKIQKVYDSIGEVRNEEGLKVGAFLAPSIESAFSRDLRPIAKAGFTKGLEVPKIRSISQAEVDALKNEEPVQEMEPKRSVFSPVNEKQ